MKNSFKILSICAIYHLAASSESRAMSIYLVAVEKKHTVVQVVKKLRSNKDKMNSLKLSVVLKQGGMQHYLGTPQKALYKHALKNAITCRGVGRLQKVLMTFPMINGLFSKST